MRAVACVGFLGCLGAVFAVYTGASSRVVVKADAEATGVVRPQTLAKETVPARREDRAGPQIAAAASSLSDSGLDARPSNTSCLALPRPSEPAAVSLTTGLVIGYTPVSVAWAPSDPNKWYVLNRTGYATRLQRNGTLFTSAGTFVDIRDRVLGGDGVLLGEAGLLSITFHPKFAQNGQVFIYYSAVGTQGTAYEARLSRFISRDAGLTLDKTSEEVLLRMPRTDTIHWGGSIQFGLDGFLYAGFGDGHVDPNAQNMGTLLGKMIRINVDVSPGYSVPASNPFVGVSGAKPEIYALGFRNPWGWSFDRANGDMWVGDVGNTLYEEVDKVVKGGNYGWAVLEGLQCTGKFPCVTTGMIDPVLVYPHAGSARGDAVIGGFVYHGTAIPELSGIYIFGDVAGKIYALRYDTAGKPYRQQLAETTTSPLAFAQDQNGEIVVAVSAGLFWITPSGPPQTSTFPQLLSQTGCVDATKPWIAASGLIPYTVNSPLWSDGADKERWIALPNGTKIRIGTNGDWDLPVGSVAVKTFRVGGKLVETRLLMHHDDGEWAGYSYEWNDAQTDATLLASGKVKTVGNQQWTFPSRNDCLACHSDVSGRTLGLETGQLNKSFTYPQTGRLANQLSTLDYIGMFEIPLNLTPDQLPRLPTPTVAGDPLDLRARSYLHANCAMCHQPGGAGRGPEDFRYSTPTVSMGALYVIPTQSTFGIPDARLLYPGHPEKSIISYRMHTVDVGKMPPLARSLVDVQGVAVVDQWILSGLGMGVADTDTDGFADNVDNCKRTSNPSQLDSDADGFGNACDADFNNDGFVNSLDLGIFQRAFGTQVGQPNFNASADMNGDGRINSLDLGLFKARFGKPVGDQ